MSKPSPVALAQDLLYQGDCEQSHIGVLVIGSAVWTYEVSNNSNARKTGGRDAS